MIHPLSTTNITGILWYQGEGDVNNESQDYSIMLEALLKLFENIFNTDEIPVFLVQIPYFSNYKSSYLLGRLNSYQYCFSIESPAYIRAGFNNNDLKIFNLANLEGYSAPAFLFEIYE